MEMWSPSGVGPWTDSIGRGSPCWLPVPLPASPSGGRESPQRCLPCGGSGLILLPPAGFARPRTPPGQAEPGQEAFTVPLPRSQRLGARPGP